MYKDDVLKIKKKDQHLKSITLISKLHFSLWFGAKCTTQHILMFE